MALASAPPAAARRRPGARPDGRRRQVGAAQADAAVRRVLRGPALEAQPAGAAQGPPSQGPGRGPVGAALPGAPAAGRACGAGEATLPPGLDRAPAAGAGAANGTGACAPRAFFEKAVAFAKKYDLILLHDFAYAEIYFDDQKPISCLSVPGAKDVCIEFHSLSKSFGMAGWRLGFAVGNAALVESLRKMKTNLDYGPFGAIVKASVTALKSKDGYLAKMRADYQKRRDIIVDGLNSMGWKLKKPCASMYVWAPVPSGFNSTSFTHHLIHETGVVVSPGVGFGDLGEGYVRLALVDSEERIQEAISRMKKAGIKPLFSALCPLLQGSVQITKSMQSLQCMHLQALCQILNCLNISLQYFLKARRCKKDSESKKQVTSLFVNCDASSSALITPSYSAILFVT